jgi:hypothetical protein
MQTRAGGRLTLTVMSLTELKSSDQICKKVALEWLQTSAARFHRPNLWHGRNSQGNHVFRL